MSGTECELNDVALCSCDSVWAVVETWSDLDLDGLSKSESGESQSAVSVLHSGGGKEN